MPLIPGLATLSKSSACNAYAPMNTQAITIKHAGSLRNLLGSSEGVSGNDEQRSRFIGKVKVFRLATKLNIW